jgi:serine/threonine-protein kinase
MGDYPVRPDSTKTKGSAPLWAEFDLELVTLERAVARAAQIAIGTSLIVAIYVALFVALAMGRALAIEAALAVAWFTVAHALLTRNVAVRAVMATNLFLEASLPAVAVVVLSQTQGAAYALGSWVPPILFACIIFLSVLRLQPVLAAGLGFFTAAEYLAIYFLLLRDAPLRGYLDGALYRPAMQFSRALTLVLLGIMGALASSTLRRAIGNAAHKARSKERARELFGKYRIGKLIASGGMGSVYEAVYCPEGGFERKVAVKRVHPHLAGDEGFVNSFREEAELGARLAHPNIVTVFDFGREGDTYFFAMEYVDGMDLSRLRKRCAAAHVAIPSRLVALIGHEIAEGLAFAHETALDAEGKPLRVVHRDLNPANVLLSRTGQVKISDFGVAKALHDATAHETKRLVGKIAYLAPELARGDAFDARVDVYSLGLVMWELLCLRQAFKRDSDAATLNAVTSAAIPPPSFARPDIAGTRWDEFCAKALNPDVNLRYASAREASVALAEILHDEATLAPGELAAFYAQVEAAPTSSTPEAVSAASDSLAAPTVVEKRLGG